MPLSISQTTRTRPSLPYQKIFEALMDSDYTLSLVFVGDQKSRTLNRTHRGKTYTPNVLSFPLSKSAGEMYINPNRIPIEARRYGMSEKKYAAYLFIHGLLHLKGYRHGATMEEAEARYLSRFF